jgi:hypothetical protein
LSDPQNNVLVQVRITGNKKGRFTLDEHKTKKICDAIDERHLQAPCKPYKSKEGTLPIQLASSFTIVVLNRKKRKKSSKCPNHH